MTHAPSGVGKGHGNRISKPPSAKQKQHLRKWGGEPIAILPSTAGYPDRSWWLDPTSREEFDREAAAQVARMKLVK
jgi:hypothetical protein